MDKKVKQTIPQWTLVVVAISATGFLTACGGGVSAEKLAGTWECDGQGRPSYEFDVAGKYVQDTLPNPNSAYPEGRATGKVNGTFGIARGVLTLTPTRILFAVEPRDFMYYLQLAQTSNSLRHVANTTFEVSPGNGYTVMSARISGTTLKLQVSNRVNAGGQVVNPPNGKWDAFECTRG